MRRSARAAPRVPLRCGGTVGPTKEGIVASRLNPYISFRGGNAREALEFYKSVLGGTLTVSTFGEYGMDGPIADKIMHGQLETNDGYTLMGADSPPEMPTDHGHTVTVCINGDADDTVRGYFEKLSAGGTVGEPLKKQMWGDEYGQFEDRFGVQWMFNLRPPTEA
jgi:PhnB protein